MRDHVGVIVFRGTDGEGCGVDFPSIDVLCHLVRETSCHLFVLVLRSYSCGRKPFVPYAKVLARSTGRGDKYSKYLHFSPWCM